LDFTTHNISVNNTVVATDSVGCDRKNTGLGSCS
jgi:hypothetical protein